MKKATVQLTHTHIHFREDGIMEIRCNENHHYELEDVKEIMEECGKLCEHKRVPTITIPGKYSNASKEALDFIFSEESTVYSSKDAYIARSLPQRLLGNFYMKVRKPAIPTRLFNDEHSAIQWLKKSSKVKSN